MMDDGPGVEVDNLTHTQVNGLPEVLHSQASRLAKKSMRVTFYDSNVA